VATRLMKEFPNRSEPVALMGLVQRSLGRTDEALRCWEECLRLDPAYADACKSMGLIALERGEFERVLELCQQALASAPTSPGLHELMAKALMNLGRPEEAIAHLEKDIEISPAASSVYYVLGEAHLRLRQYDQAKQAYQTATEMDPNIKHAYYGLATACARLGEREEASQNRRRFKDLKDKELQELIEESVGFDDVVAVRGHLVNTLVQAGQVYYRYRKTSSAELHWGRAAELDPKNTTCRTKLAELYQRVGRNRDARRICEQLVKIQPDNPVHWLNLGVLNERLSEFDAAEPALRKVIELDPKNAWGYGELARVLMRANRRLPEAKALASTAVRLGPEARQYFVLCEACDKNGDPTGALAAIERAIELEPGNVKYRQVRNFIKTRK